MKKIIVKSCDDCPFTFGLDQNLCSYRVHTKQDHGMPTVADFKRCPIKEPVQIEIGE